MMRAVVALVGLLLVNPAGTRLNTQDSNSVAQDSLRDSSVVAAGDSAARPRSVPPESKAAAPVRSDTTSREANGFTTTQRVVATVLSLAAVIIAIGVLSIFTGYAEIVRQGDVLSVRSDWGGFGGGASGWRASKSLTLLVPGVLLLAALLTMTLGLAGRLLPPAKGTAQEIGAQAKSK